MAKKVWNKFWEPTTPKVLNLETGKEEVYKGKVFNDPHLAENATTLTMREIVARAKAGTLAKSGGNTTFNSPIEQDLDSPDLEEMTRWSLDEITVYKKTQDKIINDAKAVVELKEKLKAEQADKDKFNAAVEAEILKRSETKVTEEG